MEQRQFGNSVSFECMFEIVYSETKGLFRSKGIPIGTHCLAHGWYTNGDLLDEIRC